MTKDIRRSWLVRGLLGCVALLICIGGLLTLPATTHAASAGAYDGLYPSQVSGCGNNIRAEDNTVSIYASGVYYGWAEQRYSNSGACHGYQWIRLHVTNGMYYNSSLFEAVEYKVGNPNGVQYLWLYANSYLAPGTYDLQIMYVLADRICGWLIDYDTSVGSSYFFGHGNVPNNDDDEGGAHWCA